MAKIAALLVVSVLTLAVGCSQSPARQFSKLAEEFVYTTLSFSPSAATAAGLHQYNGQNLDDQLDDMSPAVFGKQQSFYEDFRDRLGKIEADKLSPEDRADLTILQDQTALALQDLTAIHSYLHNPIMYVETLGNAFFSPFVLQYAPQPQRIQHIIARLGKVPLYLDQASTNLTSSPSLWTQVALEENAGNIALVDKTIRDSVPANLRDAYAKAAQPALAALRKFQDYLKNSLAPRNDADWRLGRDQYAAKFRYTLESGAEPDNVLEAAERDLQKVRAQMLDLAVPLHRRMFAGHGEHENLAADARQNQIIGEVLDKIATQHSTAESFLDDARKDLEQARAFVQEKRLLTLPARGNLQVIPTPEFMRGAYPVGGFSPAPPLEPELGAFYWITPIPADWPKERIESKLREYNVYKLQLLTLHEAMPGHYVQFEFANAVQPPVRRLLRSVYGNGPYIEGWGEYSEQTMMDEGYLDHSPEFALTFAKEQLRVIANAILDIRLQILNMTDQDALDFMEKQTFQEKEEAEEKLQRAKLGAAQLPTYYVGWNGWLKLRAEYKSAKGSAYSLSDFNDRALKEGAIPLPALSSLLLH
jgi:uncharacterized protein (DUF885 family)